MSLNGPQRSKRNLKNMIQELNANIADKTIWKKIKYIFLIIEEQG